MSQSKPWRKPARHFTVVANIPFNLTADIIRKLTGEESGLEAAYLVLQDEAARKFRPGPGGSIPLLALFLQLAFTVRKLLRIPRTAFTTRPGVDAVFTCFRRRESPLLNPGDARAFRDLASYLYPRGPGAATALGHAFSPVQVRLVLSDLEIDGDRGVSDLTLARWLEVHQLFHREARRESRQRVNGAWTRLKREQAGLAKRHRRS